MGPVVGLLPVPPLTKASRDDPRLRAASPLELEQGEIVANFCYLGGWSSSSILDCYDFCAYCTFQRSGTDTPLRTRSQYCHVPYPDLSQQLSNASGQKAPSAAFVLQSSFSS